MIPNINKGCGQVYLRAGIPNPSPHQHHSQKGLWGAHQSPMTLMVYCLHKGYKGEEGSRITDSGGTYGC